MYGRFSDPERLQGQSQRGGDPVTARDTGGETPGLGERGETLSPFGGWGPPPKGEGGGGPPKGGAPPGEEGEEGLDRFGAACPCRQSRVFE